MKKNILLYTFCITLLGITVVDMFNEDKKYSELENRKLKSKMEFTLKRYFDGSYPKRYEEYMSDQFLFRDTWIDIKSRSEFILGKIENNGVLYGYDKYLFEKFFEIDNHRVDTNINSINQFIKNTNIPVTSVIVPNSYEIYKDKLHTGTPVIDQTTELNEIYSKLNSTNLNLIDLFNSKREEYIYYKTDHHWTSRGAYLAYRKYIQSRGDKAINIENYKSNTINNFYGTYYSKAKPFNSVPDSLTYYDFPNVEMTINDKTYNSLYDLDLINKRDKYSLFLYGNNNLTVIKNKNIKNNKKLLVIKDSYANSMIPFLTQNYEEIHVIDLRSYSNSVSEYIKNNNIDEALIVYNFINFTRDANLVKLKK